MLPFVEDDSPEEGNDYIINGLMEDILEELEENDELEVNQEPILPNTGLKKSTFRNWQRVKSELCTGGQRTKN